MISPNQSLSIKREIKQNSFMFILDTRKINDEVEDDDKETLDEKSETSDDDRIEYMKIRSRNNIGDIVDSDDEFKDNIDNVKDESVEVKPDEVKVEKSSEEMDGSAEDSEQDLDPLQQLEIKQPLEESKGLVYGSPLSPSKYPIKKCSVRIKRSDGEEQVESDDEIQILEPEPRKLTFTPGNGCSEAEAVSSEEICVLPRESAIKEKWPFCLQATNVTVYDSRGLIMPYDQGTINSLDLYFSGTLVNIVDESKTLDVDRIGPLTMSKKRPSGRVVLYTLYEGFPVEYHVENGNFSDIYRDAIGNPDTKTEIRGIDPKLSAVLDSFCIVPGRIRKEEDQVKVKVESKVEPKMERLRASDPLHELTKPEIKKIKIRRSDPLPVLTKPEIKKIKIRRSDPPSPLKRSFDEMEGKGNTFTDNIKKVPTILKSFKKSPKFGSSLEKLLPSENKESCDAVAAFLLFILERQKIWVNKSKGISPLTDNQVLATKWFTNMYRELDRGTLYFRREIIRTTLKGHVINQDKISESLVKEILFKSILYRLLNKVETFMDYGGIPSSGSLSDFLRYLKDRKEKGEIIFTAAHQNMGLKRLLQTLEFVKKNLSSLATKVIAGARERSNRLCFKAILSIPNVGDFFAWQILTDLLECRVLGRNTDNQWTCLGPGAKNGLRRIFPLATTQWELKYTRLLRNLCHPTGSGSGYQALGLKFPAFLDKALSLKNVEHALCEYDKYFRSAQGQQVKEREYSRQKSRAGLDSTMQCEVCNGGGGGSRVSCALCGASSHQACLPAWREGRHRDGNWLCQECHKYEKAWRTEDADYEEYDESDEVAGRAHVSGGMKKAARLRNKASKKKPKTKEIECIDLSSDEDDEEIELEEDLLYYSSDDDSEEVQFISSHYFGAASSPEKSEDEDEFDPFANIEEWAADDEDNELKIGDLLDEEADDDDDIMILS